MLKVLDGLVVLQAAPSALQALLSVAGVEAISLDVLVSPAMSVSDKAMAADQARAATSGLLLGLLGSPAVSGKGIGVAVVDSGIASHSALTGKVTYSVNFATGTSGTNDEFGHGTHIAGIIAGSAASISPTSLYKTGIAPGAHLVNVRVLGPTGVGYTSDVIAGIQWVVANRARYGIRVMNLSLGHPMVASCAFDPLCLAAESAAANGLVVVASAGNGGQDDDGRTVLGSISTPGNAPAVITVGALNTWGTVSRDDDTMTTYSSRGPTRYDMGMKPDVVAPGNKIVSLKAAGSYLASTLSGAACRRQRQQRLHDHERHQHGGRDGERRRRAAPANRTPIDDGPPGQGDLAADGVADAGEGHDRRGHRRVNLHAARKMAHLVAVIVARLPADDDHRRPHGPRVGSRLSSMPGAKLDQVAGYAGCACSA